MKLDELLESDRVRISGFTMAMVSSSVVIITVVCSFGMGIAVDPFYVAFLRVPAVISLVVVLMGSMAVLSDFTNSPGNELGMGFSSSHPTGRGSSYP